MGLAVASRAPRLLKSRNLRLVKTLVETVPKQATFSGFRPNRLGDPARRLKMRKPRVFSVNLRSGRPNSSKTFVFYDDFGSLGLSVALGAPRLLKSRSLLRVKTLVETVPKRYTFSTFLLNRLGDPTRKQEMRKSRILSINLHFGRPNSSETLIFYDDFGSPGLSAAPQDSENTRKYYVFCVGEAKIT